jgi:hypothetical protein
MICFTITEHKDEECWSFETESHGLHLGYPDAIEATAAALRAFDPTIPRCDVSVSDIREYLAQEKRSKLQLVKG